MPLRRALHAELLKLTRTIALKMAVLAPMAIVALTFFMASQAPFSTLGRNATANPWNALARINFQFWGLLMLPLYITLETALIAGLDHSENQWKALLARPVPRWTFYVAKLLVVVALAAASGALLLLGILSAGAILSQIRPELGFTFPAPFTILLRQTAQMTGLAFLSLAIQHWVSLRWRSFSVAIGFGIVAMVTGFAMLLTANQYGGWPQYFPWSLPMLVVARQAHNIHAALWISVAAGLAASVAGCVDFCRRELR